MEEGGCEQSSGRAARAKPVIVLPQSFVNCSVTLNPEWPPRLLKGQYYWSFDLEIASYIASGGPHERRGRQDVR